MRNVNDGTRTSSRISTTMFDSRCTTLIKMIFMNGDRYPASKDKRFKSFRNVAYQWTKNEKNVHNVTIQHRHLQAEAKRIRSRTWRSFLASKVGRNNQVSCTARPIVFVARRREKMIRKRIVRPVDCERRVGKREGELNRSRILGRSRKDSGERRGHTWNWTMVTMVLGRWPEFSRAFVDTDLNINLRPSLGRRQLRKKDQLGIYVAVC